MTLRDLYPPIEPYASGFLKVSDRHRLYYEECGNPLGAPVLFLHGGPGAGLKAQYRQFFDPSFYRIILFDQRGAGRSTPTAELSENETWRLVEDIEKLRVHLGIERWVVFGGSWGSTLALVYALHHHDRVLGLILRGIFLGRKREMDWMYKGGADLFFPQAWQRFVSLVPEADRDRLVESYYHLLTSGDHESAVKAAQAWTVWEDALVMVDDQPLPLTEPSSALSCARIECHYMIHDLFFNEENYILNHINGLADIPCRIVQGQLDFCCPPYSAVDLAQHYPGAELHLVKEGTHWSRHPAIASELVQATDDYRTLYQSPEN